MSLNLVTCFEGQAIIIVHIIFICDFVYGFIRNTDTDSDGNKSKRGRRPKNLAPTNLDTDLTHLYRQPLPLPKPLYDDLLGLCANQHIPKHYHAFYNSLVCCGNSEQTQLDDLDELDLDEASEV